MTQAGMDSIAAHIPPGLVRDVDLYAPPGMDGSTSPDIHAVWKAVQDSHPPLFWTPRYGGHWISTRYRDMEKMLMTHQIFSSAESFIPRSTLPYMLPVQLDPPDHGKFRKLLMPAFTPAVLGRAADRARRAAIEIIERVRPQGECEFVRDFSGTMPIIAFLTLINLPEEDQPYLRNLAISMSSPTHPKSAEAWGEISDYVRRQITLRRTEPRDDLITSFISARVDDRALTDEEIFCLCLVVVGGGLDTVASMTSFAACFLAQHPEHRRELRAHPEKLGDAVEEIARRFGTSNLGRIARENTTLGDVEIRAGDMIVGMFPLAGLDETINPDPMKVDFSRQKRRHLAFGTGPHTCIGNHLARRELKIFLEEWISRIPDFTLTPGRTPQMTTGIVNSMDTLHLSWDT
jgi:cytochrome P450